MSSWTPQRVLDVAAAMEWVPGGSIELRYNFSNVRIPNLGPTLNTGGLSLLFGFYLRLQKAPDEFGHQE